jgi:fructuronate reductase
MAMVSSQQALGVERSARSPARLERATTPVTVSGVSLPRLSDRALAQAENAHWRPPYDRGAAEIGIAHLGPGAFHRAHQAPVFDQLLARDPRWAVSAIALRSDSVRSALAPQDGLYSLVELDVQVRVRIVGALRELITAAADPAAAIGRLAHPKTRLVTLTITEKGYCLDADGRLDTAHPDVAFDLRGPRAPRSAPGWLAAGLRARKAAAAGGLTIASCDNLAGNGARLRAAVIDLVRAQGDRDLAAWIEDQVRFPASMVDSITPATDDALKARVSALTGLDDAWPIQREAFTQWVIEDELGADGAALASAGVEVVRDVRPYEQAKLRLLNGAHSTLAYLGGLIGHTTVADAMADAQLAGFVERLMRRDIAPTLRRGGPDTDAYIDAILTRFRNPAIAHQLAQIAWDGSQKLPVRVLGTIADALAAGRGAQRLAVPVAAWMLYAARCAVSSETLVDPLAPAIAAIAVAPETAQVDRFLELTAVFPTALARDRRFTDAVRTAHAELAAGRFAEALAL